MRKGFFGEFKEFITRGNVLDMAVGVIVATAFGKITTSLVNDVFMPVIGWICGGIDLSMLDIILKEAVVDASGQVIEAGVTIGLGTFIGTVIDFVIVAFVVFMVIKAFNKARELASKRSAQEAQVEEKVPELSTQEKLLTEIRDLLKEREDV